MPLGASVKNQIVTAMPTLETHLNTIIQGRDHLYFLAVRGGDADFSSTADCNASAAKWKLAINQAAAAIVVLTT